MPVSSGFFGEMPSCMWGISASWVAQERFLSGQLQSGNRVLIYAGPITTPFMEDVLKLQFTMDGALMRRPFPVTFHFEMDEG